MKRARFQLAVVLIAGISAFRGAAASPPAPAAIEDRISSIHDRVGDCLSGGCAEDRELLWILSRTAGASRVVRSLNVRPHWMSESDHRRLMSSLGSLPAPEPRQKSDPAQVLVLSTNSGWSESLLVLEHATGYPGERVLAVFSAQRHLMDSVRSSPSERTWLFFQDGEVLAQSDRNFLGSRLGKRSYFEARNVQRDEVTAKSFDGADVRSWWKELPGLPLMVLHEQLVEAPQAAGWRTVLPKNTATVCGVLLASMLLFGVRSRGAGLVSRTVAGLVSRTVARLFSRTRSRRSSIESVLPAKALHEAIYRSRSLHELGIHLCSVIGGATGCEVFFLEYDRRSGVLFERAADPDGIRTVLIEAGIRPACLLPEIPSLRLSILRHKDASRFFAWPLLADTSGAKLSGVLVALKPTPRLRAISGPIGLWIERAARYHDSILDERFLEERKNGRSIQA